MKPTVKTIGFLLILLAELTHACGQHSVVTDANRADVVVYGSTPGGFCAAIAAAREGVKVILLEPTDHVGGLNTGGLSHSDSNQCVRSTVMGLFDEWHTRIEKDYARRGIKLPYKVSVKDHAKWAYEPHVAGRVTKQMLNEAKVEILTKRYLQSVNKDATRITELVTSNGTFTAKVFVDATYEGDLMAASGVSWTIGREGRSEYGESYAGKQYAKSKMRINGFDSQGEPLPLIFPVRRQNPKRGFAYHVPYRSILPKPEECTNLLVPVALSCTHVGISSIRVEPTWMILGQSAGIAAALTAKSEQAVSVQKLPYPKLRQRLLAQGQVLDLPRRGDFTVAGHNAFVIEPPRSSRRDGLMPWVWYAPTLGRGHPGREEEWMFARFHEAGIAIAGVDVGESYGSPNGRAIYQSLYDELTTKRGYGAKPVLLARSRGGLMLYNWAVEHPNSVGGIAGIYPVCNLESYPGVERAAGAYELTAVELQAQLTKHNPIDRLAPLAKANVPIFHIHGDQDRVVPLEANSAELVKRIKSLGGEVEIEVIEGQGHNLWKGWFQSQTLTDFVIARALGQPHSASANQATKAD